MTTVLPLVLGELLRAPGRALIRIGALGLAVALLASMLLFVGHSLSTMTGSAVRNVPIDWQGPVGSHAAASSVARGVAAQPGVQAAVPAATAPFAGIELHKGGGSVRAGAGAFLAVPSSYARSFRAFRFLRGSLRAGAVVLDQQLAATLRAEPGDEIAVSPRRGVAPVRLPVSGIALVTAPDVLFQPLDPTLGPAPAQPPANIAILPLQTFATRIAPKLPTIETIGASAIPGVQAGTQWQVQAQLDRATLAGSPAHALRRATSLRGGAERALPGRIVFVDNLAAALDGAATDALYAEALYIMLALPGALIGLAFAYLASLGAVERDRRTLMLLRARGARRRDLLALVGAESICLGLAAALVATGAALLALRLVHTGGAIDRAHVVACLILSAALAIGGAFAARLTTGFRSFRGTVVDAESEGRSTRAPLWQRLYLDLVALAVSGLVYWLTATTGFSAVVNPDSNPTLSLSVYMFLAPALLWIGGALLLLRFRSLAARSAKRRFNRSERKQRGFLLTSIVRRNESINRSLFVLSLLLAFGVNLAIFASTYDQQARIDAQLTLGADVVASLPTGRIDHHHLRQRVESMRGVAAVSPVDHSYAYVGPDLQDIFGVDAPSLSRATALRDSYFSGGRAAQMLSRLQASPDGVLVSQETITDYSLKLGDLLRLRLFDHATRRFKITPFHVVGVVREFPSAPKDSFMVANLRYLSRATADQGPNVLFIRSADATAAAARTRRALGREGAQVKDIHDQVAQTVSSITTVDLRGISRIEELFVLLLAAGTLALQLTVGLAERRRELATMAALGAPVRRVLAFLWSEAAVVFVGAVMLATVLGLLLAEMLVAMLQHAFDPPPDHLSIPYALLFALVAATAAGGALAAWLTSVRFRRMSLGAILREQ